MKYKLTVAGGTFDLLHVGHKSFLTQILNQTDHLILGLTSDKYVSSNKEGNFENYETRRKNLEEFLSDFKNKVEIVSIGDIYGPLLEINPDVIAVTEETKRVVEKINEKRKEFSLQFLNSIIISMDLAEDGKPISSTRIRNGEINREGRLYFKTEWSGKDFKLPDNLREVLQKPFGQVLNNIPQSVIGSKTITVGDITTKLFNEKGIEEIISIIDFQVQREEKFSDIKELGFDNKIKLAKIKNPSSEISAKLVDSIRESFRSKNRSLILIDGEDDLSVIPCLIFSPLGFSIFYGQPNKGLVEVKVTEDNKEKAFKLISSFALV